MEHESISGMCVDPGDVTIVVFDSGENFHRAPPLGVNTPHSDKPQLVAFRKVSFWSDHFRQLARRTGSSRGSGQRESLVPQGPLALQTHFLLLLRGQFKM